ncbi:MAG: hypothetical protein QOK23_4241 [Gammaproteobacteria bacterium]|jgi:hypothetical protein|nr:hypothetical protein [Gammaproteobacteria bacterium]
MVTLRLPQISHLFGTVCLIELRIPCCAQARGDLPWSPVERMRSTRLTLALLGAALKGALGSRR